MANGGLAVGGLVHGEWVTKHDEDLKAVETIPHTRTTRDRAGPRHSWGNGLYTGVYGTLKSEQRYGELNSQWLDNGRHLLQPNEPAAADGPGISVAEMCERFLDWARVAYRDDHGKREELRTLERSAKLLFEKFGLIPAPTFGRKHYFELRDELIRSRRARGTVNNRLSRVKAIFSWAADRELIPFETAARLKGIPNLKAGEQGVRE